MKLLKTVWLDLVTLGFIIVFIQIFIPYKSTLIFNPDEGIEAIKAILFNVGYSLYSDIWSDQPPGYTMLLAFWNNIVGNTVSDSRLLSILFSVLLLVSFRRILALHFGNIISIYAVLLLFFSESYIKLSVSIMQAVPSLASSLLSLYILILSERGETSLRLCLALVAGLLAGWAISIKFWVVVFIPVSNLYLLTRHLRRPFNFRRIVSEVKSGIFSKELLAFNLGWIGVFSFLLFIIYRFDRTQLLDVHFDKTIAYAKNMNMFYLLSPLFNKDRIILIFFLGSVIALAIDFLTQQKSRIPTVSRFIWIIPFSWLFTALALFWSHRPLWFHYYHLFLIPIIWISCYFPIWLAYNLARLLKKILSRIEVFLNARIPSSFLTIKSLQTFLLIGISPVLLYGFKGDIISYRNGKAKSWDRESTRFRPLITAIKENSSKGKFIYTNQPILAVYTNSLIPPEVAVVGIQVSSKNEGRNYNKRLLAAFQKHQIEQIIIVDATKFPIDARLNTYINERYQLLSNNNDILHYKRK